VVQLEVHLGQGFLHMLNMRSGHLDQAVPVAQNSTYRPHCLWGMEGPSEEPHRMKVLQPLAVRHIALAPRDVLHVAGVDHADLNALFLQE
jgi:hypothetical protein